MGRIRTVKPELIQQPWFATLTDAAARTYYGLLGVVDDLGRCAADPAFIAGQIFWGRQRTIAAIGRQLAELERASIIRRYTVSGSTYLEIVGWHEKGGPVYQHVNKPQGERFPGPDSDHDRTADRPGDVPDPIRFDPIRSEDLPPARVRAIPPSPTATPTQAPGPEARADARKLIRDKLEAARSRAAAARSVAIRPLLAFDRGLDSDLAGRIAITTSGDALGTLVDQASHAIAMAELEVTHGRKSFEWFTGAIFSGGNFARLAGMTPEDARRADPKRTGPSNVGRVEPHEPSAYGSGDQEL